MKAKSGVASGDSVKAQASIVFDTNEAIPTNVWKNTLDGVAPTSTFAATAQKDRPTFHDFRFDAKDDEKEIAEKEQEEKKKIQKEWDSVNKRTKTIPKNQGTKKDSEVHPKEAAEQEEKYISKKKSKDSGQMSLFDMMQQKES